MCAYVAGPDDDNISKTKMIPQFSEKQRSFSHKNVGVRTAIVVLRPFGSFFNGENQGHLS